ncbi:MAG: hypothetical protein ACTSO9_06365 [Candidatus Helarchaeota archaeon]
MNKPYFLYIMDVGGTCLFSQNLKNHLKNFDSSLFCGFVNAIFKFSGELNKQIGYTEEKHRISTFPINEVFDILISKKDSLLGVIVLEKKDFEEDMKIFLNEILKEFQAKYGEILKHRRYNLIIFEDFKSEVERIYMRMQILSFQIPKMKRPVLDEEKLDNAFYKLIELIDGHRDINDLATQMGYSVEKIKNMISKLLWQDLITLSEKIYDTDIFEPKRDLFYLVRTKNLEFNEKNKEKIAQRKIELDLLKSIDGFKTVEELASEFSNLTIHDVKHIISYYLLQKRYLEKVELCPIIINIDEKLRKGLTTNTLALSYSLENICDGELSISDIADRFEVLFKEIKDILDYFGKFVTYKKRFRN